MTTVTGRQPLFRAQNRGSALASSSLSALHSRLFAFTSHRFCRQVNLLQGGVRALLFHANHFTSSLQQIIFFSNGFGSLPNGALHHRCFFLSCSSCCQAFFVRRRSPSILRPPSSRPRELRQRARFVLVAGNAIHEVFPQFVFRVCYTQTSFSMMKRCLGFEFFW